VPKVIGNKLKAFWLP